MGAIIRKNIYIMQNETIANTSLLRDGKYLDGHKNDETHYHTKRLVPESIELALNVIRFTSLLHIYYAMFFFLWLILMMFFTVANSQKEFNSKAVFAYKLLFNSISIMQRLRQPRQIVSLDFEFRKKLI